MSDAYLGKAIVLELTRSPVKHRDIHHAVDDGPTDVVGAVPCGILGAVPSPDEAAAQVIARGEEGCGQEIAHSGLLVAGEAVVGTAHQVPHEADVMMQLVEVPHGLVHELLGTLGGLAILLVAGGLVHQPVQAGPEAIGPPTDAFQPVAGAAVMNPVLRGVGNLVPAAESDLGELGVELAEGLVDPGLVLGDELLVHNDENGRGGTEVVRAACRCRQGCRRRRRGCGR